MIIQSGSIGMNSTRRYSSSKVEYCALKVWDNSTKTVSVAMGNEAKAALGEKPAATGYGNIARNILETKENSTDIQDAYNVSKPVVPAAQELVDKMARIRQETLEYLMRLLFGERVTQQDKVNSLATQQEELAEPQLPQQQQQQSVGQTIGGSYSNYFYYSEKETTRFSTTGTVVTKDGREINFDVSVTMSRSFEVERQTNLQFGAPNYCDPLVINLDYDVAEVSEQKFYFDLDADGHDEYISKLSYNSGYLALDKNGDGIINDGTELFGTASGNGFADLKKYDTDNNGWIDEADAIFDQLLIWRIKENGEQELCGLGKAGVGAICLGASETEFALKDSGNTTNAMIRQTGIFLYENGNMGTVQQLDLAT
ncbi:MAG: hypothetical protein U0K68_11125 [Agathobacter sp.]|nr:hypothetical protein [Agathobacter sp.]